MPNSRARPYLLILIAGIIWGSTFSLILIATQDGTHPLALATWQSLISAVVFAIFCLATRVTLFSIAQLRHYSVLAVIGICAPNLLYYNAAPHLSAGILSITIATVPLFTYAIMWLMRYESLQTKRVLGVILGMLAILLLVLPDQGLNSDDASFWILLVVLCAIFYATENVYIAVGVSDDIDIREILCGSNILAAIVLVPITLWLDVSTPVSWLLTPSGWAISATAVLSVLAYTLFFYAIRTSGPVFASQCAYVVTLSGVIWGIIIFSEQHTVWIWLSVLVMMVGMALVTPSKHDKNTSIDNHTGECR